MGLECLRLIGTDTALMQINGLAQRLKYKALQQKANECMERIASDRKMAREQLEDRIVPDCDLDERGRRVFDFGPRQFTFVLSDELKPGIKDIDGNLKSDLPKPTSKDDSEKARAAMEAWKLLKQQLKEVIKIQAWRLEQAMITGRRWSAPEFDQLIVHHPLMINIANKILFGQYDGSGNLKSTFRVTEDQKLSNLSDRDTELDEKLAVGIVHPLHLLNSERDSWNALFADYKIFQPFAQLHRAVHFLNPDEPEGKNIVRFAKTFVPATTLFNVLDGADWVRGTPQDAGCIEWHSKYFPAADITAVVGYQGVPVGYFSEAEDQTVEQAFFVQGTLPPVDPNYLEDSRKMLLTTVDPIVVSEVLANLIDITNKALATKV